MFLSSAVKEQIQDFLELTWQFQAKAWNVRGFYLFFVVLGMESRTSLMLGKNSTAKLHLQILECDFFLTSWDGKSIMA